MIHFFELGQYLTLESLKILRDRLDVFYQQNTFLMVGSFIVIIILLGLFLVPGATFLSFAAGLVFGSEVGVGVIAIGSTLGAGLAFLVSRYLLKDWVEMKFSKWIEGVNENLCEKPLNSVLFFRLIPLFPFFAVNIGFALSQVPFKYFLFGTLLGKLPATYIYTTAGDSLARINSMSEIMTLKVFSSLFLLGALAIVPIVFKKIKA